jgi:hypothetical protein
MVTLTEHHIGAELSARRRVEQFLPPRSEGGVTILRWLDLSCEDDSYILSLHEVFDDGSPDYVDVYSFEQVAPDEAPARHSFPSLSQALEFAASTFAAPKNNYVSQGLIQDEYAAYLLKSGRC